ncbi:MAG: response regulator [Dermatophilaceae bacterium]
MEPALDAAGDLGIVLVCDDTESIRRLVAMNLEIGGFEVLEAPDGETAIEILRHRSRTGRLPDVVIVDVQMTPGDGWFVLHRIREDPALVHLPVVMTSAADDYRDDRQWQRSQGLDSWVKKPFDPERLIQMVSGYVAHGRAYQPTSQAGGSSA